MSLMERFADPNLITGMTMGEKLTGSLITAIMGMGITFIVLIIIWVCIALMTKIVRATEPKKAEPGVTKAVASAAAPAIQAPTEVTAASDAELVAVITAAIAAYTAGGSSKLLVKRIRRMAGPSTSWESAGRAECADSRKFY